MNIEPIIGLEIHVQLKTKTKMFCRCDNTGENQPANTTICPVCFGHPGTLPVINQQAVECGLKAAMALHCRINSHTKFDRKNYFYPDLPKGYQISQYDQPLASGGYLMVGETKIALTRLHLEEDAAKLFHSTDKKNSLIDFNRAGTPLIEIVTEPVIATPALAKEFLQNLRLLMRYLEVSDADMEKGHLRCDANISLRPAGTKKLYPKTEIKNLNSFRAVERALAYEIQRQTKLWDAKKPPTEETTRGWDENKKMTVEQRSKEAINDYRYFPEPDLPPLQIDHQWLKKIKQELPEMPAEKAKRFAKQYQFAPADLKILTNEKWLADYAEKVISELRAWLIALEEMEGSEQEIWKKYKKKLSQLTANWLINKLGGLLTAQGWTWEQVKITPENFAEFITLIYQNKITSNNAQTVLKEMLLTGADPSHVLAEKKLTQISDKGSLTSAIQQAIKTNPDQVAEYKKGKAVVLQFLIGQVMRATRGQANPQVIDELLKKELK